MRWLTAAGGAPARQGPAGLRPWRRLGAWGGAREAGQRRDATGVQTLLPRSAKAERSARCSADAPSTAAASKGGEAPPPSRRRACGIGGVRREKAAHETERNGKNTRHKSESTRKGTARTRSAHLTRCVVVRGVRRRWRGSAGVERRHREASESQELRRDVKAARKRSHDLQLRLQLHQLPRREQRRGWRRSGGGALGCRGEAPEKRLARSRIVSRQRRRGHRLGSCAQRRGGTRRVRHSRRSADKMSDAPPPATTCLLPPSRDVDTRGARAWA